MSLLQKVEWEVQTGMCGWSTSTFENSCGCTALDMPEWRQTTEQIDRRAKLSSQVNCFSKDLKCWEAWDTTSGHKAKDITPLIAWRREALKEEALDDLPWKDSAIFNQTNILTVLKVTLGKLLRAFPRAQIPSWTELLVSITQTLPLSSSEIPQTQKLRSFTLWTHSYQRFLFQSWRRSENRFASFSHCQEFCVDTLPIGPACQSESKSERLG